MAGGLPGQARKSLWIETPPLEGGLGGGTGQARKSLWIETDINMVTYQFYWVRLVRACGSKPSLPTSSEAVLSGQARKSLWIETCS